MLARILVVSAALACSAGAYSVLSHEAIIDSAWDQGIKPALLQRFPDATEEDLTKAHAYAYGGAIIQDLGYYPFGNHLFSDLTHYVRSGDFILNLLAEARDLNEYAFALGSLAHYAADNNGHPIGVNRSVPLLYPDLRKKYGHVVTYEDDPSAHLKTEFGFDVTEVANGHFAPQAYHDFIGFEVAKPLVERAFRDTYDLELKDVFASVDLALGTYRHTVSKIIPEMTKVAWDQKKDQLRKETPGLTKRKFVYNLSRSSYEKEWGRQYQKPGVGARILAFFLNLIPKVGPFKALSFKPPSPQAEKLFMESFNRTLDQYRQMLAGVRQGVRPELPNDNFDTGKPTRIGAYKLADQAYSKLLAKLGGKKGQPVSPDLRANILRFYGSQSPADEKAAAELAALREATPAPAAK